LPDAAQPKKPSDPPTNEGLLTIKQAAPMLPLKSDAETRRAPQATQGNAESGQGPKTGGRADAMPAAQPSPPR
jgi:hypothetical protein